jgi:hypothetical protein
MSDQCTAPATSLFASLAEAFNSNSSNSLLAPALLLFAVWLLVDKLQQMQVLYHVKIALEYLLVKVPRITVEMTAAESTDDGVKGDPVDKIQVMDKNKKDKIQCFDPSTKQWLGDCVAMTPAQVHQLCVKAAAAQKTWSKTTFAQRRAVLRTIQQYVVCHIRPAIRESQRSTLCWVKYSRHVKRSAVLLRGVNCGCNPNDAPRAPCSCTRKHALNTFPWVFWLPLLHGIIPFTMS